MFACERFNEYINGQWVIVRSDHQPLETNQQSTAKRFLLRLQKYDLLVFTPRNEFPVANTLSRAHLTKQVKLEVLEQKIQFHIHPIFHQKLKFFLKKNGQMAND